MKRGTVLYQIQVVRLTQLEECIQASVENILALCTVIILECPNMGVWAAAERM